MSGTRFANQVSATSNRLTSVQRVDSTGALVTDVASYDNAGNITGNGSAGSAVYSDRGRLSQANVPTSATTTSPVNYWYNGLEQRLRKSGSAALIPTGAAHYVYDEDGHVLGEYDASGIPVYEVVWLGEQPVAVIKQSRTGSGATLNVATRVDYVYADHLNTPRVVARSTDHAIVWRWDSIESFGVTPANDNPNALGAYSFNLRFPGQVYDRETTGHYNLHRDYGAWVGRYMQSDPIGLAGGVNTCSYVGANPLSYVDPDGLDALFVHYIGYSVAITNNISAPLGHAGAVAVDPMTGKTQYYEFGRYGGKCGNVRGPIDVGRVAFDKDGNPTRDSIEAVLKTASSAYGKNSPTYYEYSKKPYQDVIEYAERRKREADTCERPYRVITDNCKNFGHEAAGR